MTPKLTIGNLEARGDAGGMIFACGISHEVGRRWTTGCQVLRGHVKDSWIQSRGCSSPSSVRTTILSADYLDARYS